MSTRLALVTGTSSGIGAAVARELLSRKWRVVGISRRLATFEHDDYLHLQLDLATVSALTARLEDGIGSTLADPSLARVGLVNCAAEPALLGPIDGIDPAQMLHASAVNVVAPVCLMGFVVRHYRHGVPVRIVNVSSGADTTPYPGLAAYGSTKAALRMAGMVLASELDEEKARRARDITILSYGPGVVDTPMQEAVRSSSVATLPIVGVFKELAADGRLAPPSRPAAEIVAYLDADGHERFLERSAS